MPEKNPDYNVSFGEAFKRFWKNYANFSGRATRSEFWWWVLADFLITSAATLILFLIITAASLMDDYGLAFAAEAHISFLNIVWWLATLVPSFALGFRRMHDVGRSGAWIFAPVAGFVFVLLGIGSAEAAALDRDAAQILIGLGVLLGGLVSVGFGIFVFVCTLLDSRPGKNEYGQSEKYL